MIEKSKFPGVNLIFCSYSIDSLRKLHYKAKATDAFFDPPVQPSTTKVAWNEVKDSLEHGAKQYDAMGYRPLLTTTTETRIRQTFMNTLTVDVINPLSTLKVCQGRHKGSYVMSQRP